MAGGPPPRRAQCCSLHSLGSHASKIITATFSNNGIWAVVYLVRAACYSQYITFLDLANAFGSVSHQFICDMLVHAQLPTPVVRYLQDLYSKLQAFVSTPDWCTDTFAVQRGVFQGDTLSPIIFLLCFDPVIKLATQDPSKGYVPSITIPDSESLPPVDATIYLLWDEEPSPELTGWYKCKVLRHMVDGVSTVSYSNHSTETLDLHLHKWKLARANATAYLPPAVTSTCCLTSYS